MRLSEFSRQGTVVLLALRGFPGYQCPLCNRQVQDYLEHAAEFERLGVRVVMVYPGPAEGLANRAAEFMADKTLPDHFEMLLDPDYTFTNLYGLRWDAPRETAYPSTFVINREGIITFARISNSHGGRTKASDMIRFVSAN